MHGTEAVGESDALIDARRYLEICNACRYCEGYCAVFPAMEQRREFSAGDVSYLANLCHGCKGCFYSCQFAPPHEWNLNLPRVFAELRDDSYAEHAWPAALGGLYRRNGVVLAAAMAGAIALVLIVAMILSGSGMFGAHAVRPGAFYEVIPFPAMMWTGIVTLGWAVLAGVISTVKFWRASGAPSAALLDVGSWKQATSDAVKLTYLDGDGHGCNEATEAYTQTRRHLHHAMAGGFVLCLAATAVATVFHHLLGWVAPYAIYSPPVLLGLVGGVLLLAGTAGLFAIKLRADPVPSVKRLLGAEVAIVLLLACIALSGLLLLALRGTGAMGTLLAVHLGFVLALFVTLPYSKMMHAPFRFLALLRNAYEAKAH